MGHSSHRLNSDRRKWPHVSRTTVRVFKNDARLRKPFRCCSAFPLLTWLGRRKRSPGRSVSEAALRFGNLCVFKPSALRKKPLLRKKPSIPGRSLPICGRSHPICSRSCAANTFWKSVPNVGVLTRTVAASKIRSLFPAKDY